VASGLLIHIGTEKCFVLVSTGEDNWRVWLASPLDRKARSSEEVRGKGGFYLFYLLYGAPFFVVCCGFRAFLGKGSKKKTAISNKILLYQKILLYIYRAAACLRVLFGHGDALKKKQPGQPAHSITPHSQSGVRHYIVKARSALAARHRSALAARHKRS
jgi:hypothetical protein